MLKILLRILSLCFIFSGPCSASDDLDECVQNVRSLLSQQTPMELNADERSKKYQEHMDGFALLGFIKFKPDRLREFLSEDSVAHNIPHFYITQALKLALKQTDDKSVMALLTTFKWLANTYFPNTDSAQVTEYVRSNPSMWKRYCDIDLERQYNPGPEEDLESKNQMRLRLSFMQAAQTLSEAMIHHPYSHKYYQEPKETDEKVFLSNEINFLQEFVLSYFPLIESTVDVGELLRNAYLSGNREFARRILSLKPEVCFSMSYDFLIHDVIAMKSYSNELYQNVHELTNYLDIQVLINHAIRIFDEAFKDDVTEDRAQNITHAKKSFCKTLEMAVLDAAVFGRVYSLRYIMNLPNGYAPDFSKSINNIPELAIQFSAINGHVDALNFLIETFSEQLQAIELVKFVGRAFVHAVLNWKKDVAMLLLYQPRVVLYKEYFDCAVDLYDGNDVEMKLLLEAAKLYKRPVFGLVPSQLTGFFQLRNR